MPVANVFHRAPLTAPAFAVPAVGAFLPSGFVHGLILEACEAGAENVSFSAAASLSFETTFRAKAVTMAEEIERRDPKTFFASPADFTKGMEDLTGLYRLFTCTGEKSHMVAVLTVLQYELRHFDEIDPAVFTAGGTGRNEMLAVLCYEATGKDFLLKLLEKARAAFPDHVTFLATFDIQREMSLPYAELCAKAAAGEEDGYYANMLRRAQGRNIADAMMGAWAMARFSGSGKAKEAAITAYDRVTRYHGLSDGAFSANSCLAGSNPSRGTDAATIAACCEALTMIATLETDAHLCDLLEKLQLNALLRLRKAWTPLVAVNSLDTPDDSLWYTEPAVDDVRSAYLTGLGTLASSVCMASSAGIAVTAYRNGVYRAVVSGVPVRVSADAKSFSDCTFIVDAKDKLDIKFSLRIPEYAQGFQVLADGEDLTFRRQGGFAVFTLPVDGRVTLRARFRVEPVLKRGFHRSAAIEYGPLLMCLPACARWNVALTEDAPMMSIDGIKYTATAKAAPVADWKISAGIVKAPPVAPVADGEAFPVKLVPFADCAWGIAQFPVLKGTK